EPRERRNWRSKKRIGEGTRGRLKGERRAGRRSSEYQENLGSIRISERNIFDSVVLKRRAGNAVRAGDDKFTDVAEQVIVHVIGDRTVLLVDRNHPSTIRAAVVLRSALLIQRNIPERHRFRPMAYGANDEVLCHPQEILR